MKQSSPDEHSVKCEQRWYEEVLSGRKRFEVRLDDRGYHEGDSLTLNEIVPVCPYCRGTGNTPGLALMDEDPTCSFCRGNAIAVASGHCVTRVIGRIWRDLPGLNHGYVILELT